MVNQLVKFRLLILNFLEWCHRPFGKIIPAETFRYVAMGGVITFVDIFLYFICYNFVLKKQMVDLGFVVMSAHIASFVFVFPITFFTGFLSSRYITFTGSSLKGNIQLFRYALAVAGSIIINYVFLKLFVEHLYIWPTVSKVLTTIVVVMYSYIIQRYFTFKTANFQSWK